MLHHLDTAITRREILRLSAAGVAGASLSGWMGLLADHAARAAAPLPNFVVTGALAGKNSFLTDAGYRGSRHEPLVLNNPGQGLENLKPPVLADDFDDRAGVLDQLEQNFARTSQAGAATAHATSFR